jgi:hypothetical protein
MQIAGAISQASGRTVDADRPWVLAFIGTGLLISFLVAVNGLALDYGPF